MLTFKAKLIKTKITHLKNSVTKLKKFYNKKIKKKKSQKIKINYM